MIPPIAGIPGLIVVAATLLAIVGSALRIELPAGRSAYLILGHVTFSVFSIAGMSGLVAIVPGALAVLIARVVMGARRRPTLDLGVTILALVLSVLLADAVNRLLGGRFPMELRSVQAIGRTILVLVIAYVTFVASKEMVNRKVFGLTPMPDESADELERAFPLYLLGAMVVGPIHIGSIALFTLAGPMAFTIVFVSAPIAAQLLIPFEVARVRRLRALKDESTRRSRLDSLTERSTRIAHHLRHQIALIGLSVSRIDARLRDLGVRDETILREELERLERAKDELRELLVDEPTDERTEPGRSWRAMHDAVAERATALAEPREVRIVRVEGPIPSGGPAGSRRIEQAWFNVVENAVVAASTSVTLRIDSTDDGVAFVAEDDGPGMTEEVRARATDPFFTTKSGGTGMGLAIARAVAEGVGGELRLERPMRGMRVVMWIPTSRPS